MSAEPLLPTSVPPPASSPARFFRLEYVGFQDVGEHREFRFQVRSADGSAERRLRVATVAFGAGRIRLQDGPDVCYQKLLRTLAAGEVALPEMITVDDADLAGYAEEHTRTPKHRSWSSAPPTVVAAPRDPGAPLPRERSPTLATAHPGPALEGGQRVTHAVFGLGVMSAPTGGHTIVHFDQDGPKKFVTSILQVDVLSAPHTWETGPRGKNRPCP